MEISTDLIHQIVQRQVTVAETVGISLDAVEMLAAIGAQFYEQGRYDDARQIFKGVGALNAKSYLGPAGLGVIALAADDWDSAIGHLRRAHELNDRDPAVCGNLGEAHLRKGEKEEAVRYLRQSASLDPAHLNPYANRARGILLAIE